MILIRSGRPDGVTEMGDIMSFFFFFDRESYPSI